MAQQTAVEWLVEQINMDNVGKAIIITFHNEFEQAKQMEKEQIMKAYHQGVFGNIIINNGSALAEHYFNKTYGSNNQI